MEKFREIEVDLQNAIEEVSRIPTLFDYYLEERNEYHKILENDLFTQRDKLQKELSALNKLNQQNLEKRQLFQRRINKALKYINDNIAVCAFNNKELPHWEFDDNNIQNLIKILEGEDNE